MHSYTAINFYAFLIPLNKKQSHAPNKIFNNMFDAFYFVMYSTYLILFSK